LVGDLFEFSELSPSALKGFAEPVRAWRVVREGRAETRFEALHGTRLTPLVGRGEEIELVLSRWQQAKEGSGQDVLVSANPDSVNLAWYCRCVNGSTTSRRRR